MVRLRMCGLLLSLLGVLVIGVDGARGQERETLPNHFPYPKALRPQVEFWKKIFTIYSRYQVVIHDSETMTIYRVLDFRRLRDDPELDDETINQIKQDQTKLEVEQVRSSLIKLQGCEDGVEACDSLDLEEKKLRNLFKHNKNVDRFREAASDGRLRTQTGVRERFREGVQVSRRYMKAMEDIFRREGLPIELTRLPLIESSFNLGATSKVGAAGIWQFMPSTGRIYAMRINNNIDERRDPLIATEAAARFLRANYEMLGSWPLAITAYNHGPGGVANAVSTVGSSDIADIILSYRGRAFGFASRNFYPEFLAAVEIEKDHKRHFGPMEMEGPISYDEVTLDAHVSFATAANLAGIDTEELRSLNPALGSAIRQGSASIPEGYGLRIPAGAFSTFTGRFSAWREEERARIAAAEKARKARLEAARQARAERQAALRKARAERRGIKGASPRTKQTSDARRKRR